MGDKMLCLTLCGFLTAVSIYSTVIHGDDFPYLKTVKPWLTTSLRLGMLQWMK